MLGALFRVKSITQESAQPEEARLKRVLGPFELLLLGIGAIVGAGIFAVTGTAAAGLWDPVTGALLRPGAGPAIIVSFLITSIACALCALCYAELASLIPTSGSAYTYTYATMGEVVAWVIGWDLILEYAFGNVPVAVSWSGYFLELLKGFGVEVPQGLAWLTVSYAQGLARPEVLAMAPRLFGWPVFFNFPAFTIVMLLTGLLVVGIKEGARFNALLVCVKLVILLFFVLVGAFYVKPENWHPFAPFGWNGVMTGAALVFFAYIGFDAISTTSEETKNPKKDIPFGILGSLIVCTILYVLVAGVLTGLVPYRQLGVAEPLALVLRVIGLNFAAGVVAFGALIATTTVLLVFHIGQTRILFAMSRDGLLPPVFARIHPQFRTPHVSTMITGVVVALVAGFIDIGEAVELSNIGTLFAFVLVSFGIIVLRYKSPHLERSFRVPFVPWLPLLGAAFCFYLMASLPWITWVRFFVWLGLGLVVYLGYGLSHSRLHKGKGRRSISNDRP